MAKLIIVVEVEMDPTLQDPHEVADYLLDDRADDPVPTFVSAEWSEENRPTTAHPTTEPGHL